MSNGPEGLIKINPVFSMWLASYLLAIHLAALLMLLPLQLPTPTSIILAISICISLTYYWKRDLLHRGRSSVNSAKWSKEGGWQIIDEGGEVQTVKLSQSSFISQYLVLLCFKTTGNNTLILLLPEDAMDPGLMRRLRVLMGHFGE